MFLRIPLVALGALAVILIAAAEPRAETFTPAPNQKFSLDLDTKEGHASHWSHMDLGSINGLRATIEIPSVGSHEQWNPVFTILVGTGSSTGPSYGLRLRASRGETSFAFNLYDGQTKKEEPIGQSIGLKQRMEIEFNWSIVGRLSIRVGNGRRREIALSGPIAKLSFSSSTGELLVHSLVLGRFTR